MSETVSPFRLSIGQAQLDDLRERLRHVRWPERETVGDRSQGLKLEAAQALHDYWLNRYDWRRCERALNRLGQFTTEIDGLDIHFLHVRSPEPDALPLIITHGWPGSVIEFLKIIGPLTDPRGHGGDPADAFHVVAPSLPGFGFSGKPDATGWTTGRTADAWIALMRRLGYRRFVAQGGDWGSLVTTMIGEKAPPELLGIHLNAVVAWPAEAEMANLSPDEQRLIDDFTRFQAEGSGYSAIQSTRPQTLGYGLADSPMGLAGWIFEKFVDHTDCGEDLLSLLDYDELIDNIMFYWLPGTGASSARIYWESFGSFFGPTPVEVPTACSLFLGDVLCPPRHWAERKYPNIVHWRTIEPGGHFAAFEQPELFVRELRDGFRSLR
jgi:pimeloyl-ACP methyl ester carboxylesterase